MIDVQMGITRDEQINIAVAIIVAPGRPGHEATAAHVGLFRNILEFTATQPVVKSASPKASNE